MVAPSSIRRDPRVTEWILRGGKIGPPSFEWRDHSGWLYAFVVDGELKYIGLTDRVLRSRMSDYSHRWDSQTVRLRDLIIAELAGGRAVDVFGWKQRDRKVLVAEDGRLRLKYRPPWNRAQSN